jgi:hypothetical protein
VNKEQLTINNEERKKGEVTNQNVRLQDKIANNNIVIWLVKPGVLKPLGSNADKMVC